MTRYMRPEDATRRTRFNPTKLLSDDPEICTHTWLRFSGFDECPHCGTRS